MYLRINIDLAVKETATGTVILKNPDGSGGIRLPTNVITALNNLKTTIQTYKQYCAKVNAGQANEENSVVAEYFICHHDSNGVQPDEPRITI
jgi:hypothetical protein